MANKNKRLVKLRAYRDRLIEKNVNLARYTQKLIQRIKEARSALHDNDVLRALALLSYEEALSDEFIDANELTNEITLVYRFLVVEREYTNNIQIAAANRDYLRVAALTAEHKSEIDAHDKILSSWSKEHGFTRKLRKEMEDEDVI